ncbi:protein NO VEIN domain-containing protein [Streptomyces sp. NPDC058280]|uniref:protein NO VEIN domain-containing protein n=1 Tax=Streptomyces sp. NPDC058280 TaxID=3346419 RepID=UPI0036E08041
MGEWYAYQWLCARYPDRTDETGWVSGNRRKAFPGPSGDDGLGFDFRVGSGSRPYLYEVKATGGEGGRFELGESEVHAARQHAGNDRWRLLVVTHALTPHKMAIQMLPNPYGKRGRGRYREEGGHCASRTTRAVIISNRRITGLGITSRSSMSLSAATIG